MTTMSAGSPPAAGRRRARGKQAVEPVEVRVEALAELCEPLFLYVCRLNRSARKGAPALDVIQVRGEVKALVKTIASRCADAGLGEAFAGVRKALVGFADYMLLNSGLVLTGGEWTSLLAKDPQEPDAEYDRHFYDEVDALLEDPGPQATQKLAVYYNCLGLGFAGMYKDAPDKVRIYTSRIAARLGDLVEADENLRVCEQAYKHTDERVIQRRAPGGMLMLVVAVAGLVLISLIVSGALYKLRTGQVESDLQYLQERAAAPAK